MAEYKAHIFGKHGCMKCALLRRRLETLLQQPEYASVEIVYHDVLTQDGIVAFCKTEVLNPNRIPALLMEKEGSYMRTGVDESRYVQSTTPGIIGIQTDYDNGGGVITPAAIRNVLDAAVKQ